MTHSLETRSYQKTRTELRFDHKLVTSLQILQMPVKELEPFLEEKLVLNPLIPLDQLRPKELLLGDLGIPTAESAMDPRAEESFWQALLQNETEKSAYSEEDLELKDLFSPAMSQMVISIPFKKGKEHEIDLFIFFCKSKWQALSFQPYDHLIEKALHEHKITPKEHFHFLKELKSLHYALSSRKTLLTSIGLEIAAQWNFLFQNGELIPLDLSAISPRLNRHRTTILRAIRGKKCCTPRGVFPLEAFFEGARARKARLSQKNK